MNLPKIKRIVYSPETLQERISQLGGQITRDYAEQELILVSVLKGSFYFLADLSRAIDLPVRLDFMSIGVYPQVTSQTGVVRITKDLDLDITGKHVLIIEDIIRTGLTTGYLVQTLSARMPSSIKVCSLLVNPEEQLINVPMAYTGFEVTSRRLVGYGLDIGERWRNLPYIAELDREE
ncbi:hypoxanthine phosphoribosyltransferase [Papillibacter cinnamivorans]|uniref:Hypoxanthine phosphoribosyltransferase n=1 Tax=Papillibacter cinnamivorans DSM 12816 TaxID=1122930 RepID=A0A1W2B9L0_9FIRM|nr:hypoxanthine phosphoribosyltransferase [Papillibacter cinnamivorans]SMC69667.1 hypoxanthine phosphoribosyltransferase [Papillibacter cinnamivorans DSM 12816]